MTSKHERLVVLGRLSSVLAHEIRNPLAGISAATQMLGGKLDPTDPKRKYVGMILDEIGRVEEIVKDLLDYSRDGQACMMKADLRSIVEKALSSFADAFERLGVCVNVHHDGAMPFVRCDAEQIERAFRNLIANAVDAMAQGGALTIRTAHDARTGEVTVTFEDTGVGTDLDDLGELFSPFYTTKTKGNGLGLPVALKALEEHGGTITPRRGASCGLTMVVRWPALPADRSSVSEDAPGMSQAAR
jgi:signal transduction histidine kinase